MKCGVDYFKTENGYYRLCPICGETIIYTALSNVWQASKSNSKCQSCKQSGQNNHRFGKPAPNRGMKNTLEYKQKMSERLSGKNNPMFGRKHSHKTLALIRKKCTPFIQMAGKSVDQGAPEYFDMINAPLKEKFVQNWYCKELGYFADGWNEALRIWIEFDTPYHNKLQQQKLDKQRQDEIIHHFKNVVKDPFFSFVRVDSKTRKATI